MKSNLVVLCVDNLFGKKVAKSLSENFDMKFVDTKDILNYELEDAEKIIANAGVDYFNKLKSKIIKRIFTFENTVISIDMDLLKSVSNSEKFKNSATFIYLKLNEEMYCKSQRNNKKINDKLLKINELVFDDRQKYYETFSDIIVEITNNKIKDATICIINKLREKFV